MGRETEAKALKSGIWYTAANILTRGMSFLTMPFFTRMMTKADIGNFSNYTSWIEILSCVLTLNLCNSVTLAKFEYRTKLDEFISSILFLGSLSTAAFFLLLLPFKNRIIVWLSMDEFEYYLMFIICFFSPALQILQIKSRLDYHYKLSVALSLGLTVACTAVSLFLVAALENKLMGRLIGNYVPAIILNLVIYVSFMIHAPSIKADYWGYALTISLPLIVHALSAHVLSVSDRIMITNLCGAESNALYSLGYSCSMVVSILWYSMNTAWAPWAYEQMDKKNYAALKKASRPYLLFFGFLVLAFLLLAPDLLLLMGGQAYTSALTVIPPVMVAFVFQFVYSLYVNIETFHKKQHYIAIGTAIAAALNIILNLIFIPLFGFTAAAYTTLAGYIVLLLIHYFFVRKMNKVFFYDTLFNALFLLFFLLQLLLVQFLYREAVVRYAVIVTFAIFGGALCVILKDELIYLVKNRSAEKLAEKLRRITKKN